MEGRLGAMHQHMIHDPAAAEYSGVLDAVWSDWEPWLGRCERLLRNAHGDYGWDEAEEVLRRAQYRSHTAAEFTDGLTPPHAAFEAHTHLVTYFNHAREVLGALAARMEMDELDEQSIEHGLRALDHTRQAYHHARNASVMVVPFTQHLQPLPMAPTYKKNDMALWIWGMVGVCAVLFTLLMFELFMLTPEM